MSTFSGTITSDFMKLANIPLLKRPPLINFAATDYVSIRDSLIEYAKAVYPLDYQYFVESDLGMVFLEMIAYMGAVLSMKGDMLANENFLATAKQRASVKKLLELIGVRLKGPLSATGDAKVEFSPAPTGTVNIATGSRIITITSPEDGGAITYTLYKVVNGQVEPLGAAADIDLALSEAVDANQAVYTNLALQEGALVTDTGSFVATSTDGTKTIALTQNPVIDGSVQVYITSDFANTQGAYTEVDNLFFASGTNDKIFEVIYDEQYNATIVFGDGTVGISPNVGATYLVVYRIGGGSRGNLVKNAMNANITARENGNTIVGTVTNSSVITGGANAETIQHARKWAPLTFRRQDRIVTLEDFEVFANNFTSTWGTVGKAKAATRKAYSSANIIDLYVLEKANDLQLQKATPTFKTSLLTSIEGKKMATVDVVIVDGLIRTFDLITTIRIDREQDANQDQIVAKVRNKILEYLSVDNREFGQALIIPDLNRQIFEVEEVRYSTIDNLAQDVVVDANEIIQLNNLTINVDLLK